ncbi:MAG: DUF4416 family protein [Rectinema sp.]
MGIEKEFIPERLIVGVLSSDAEAEIAALDAMIGLHGPLCFQSDKEPFLWTRYYCPEMGEDILRSYWAFGELIDPSRLSIIKRATNSIEQRLARNGCRLVNLDPGMLGTARFCLATTKDRSHRIPLSDGIYAELTLIFEHGEFKALPWTYPDWASVPVRNMMTALRAELLGDLRHLHFL